MGGLGGRVGEARQVLAVPWRVTTVESLQLQIDTVYPMLHAGMKIGVMVSAESSFQARWLSEAQWAFLQIADSTMAGADVRAGPMTTARSSFVLVFRNLVDPRHLRQEGVDDQVRRILTSYYFSLLQHLSSDNLLRIFG